MKIMKSFTALLAFILSLCIHGEAGAVPVIFTSETYYAGAGAEAWDTNQTPLTLIASDSDNPTPSSTPPLSANASISDAGAYDAIGYGYSDQGYIAESGFADNRNPYYLINGYGHGGFEGEFTATTSKVFFSYDMSYSLSASGNDAYASFSYAWTLYDKTTNSEIDSGWAIYAVTSGSQSDTVSAIIPLPITVGNQYTFNFVAGIPPIYSRVIGTGEAGASLTANYSLDTVSAAVPEPGTLLLLGSGLVGVAALRRKFLA